MAIIYGSQGVSTNGRGLSGDRIELAAGNTWIIPSGTWFVSLGFYLTYQEMDWVTNTWRSPGGTRYGGSHFIKSDGVNMRITNQTGCVVGAYPSTAGSGYTPASPPTLTVPSGASLVPIIGGALSVASTLTPINGGFNYVYPPIVVFPAPPYPGLTATGYATLSGGAVSTVTVLDQGAGYTSPPVPVLYNDPRDTTGYGAQMGAAPLISGGTLTGVLVGDHGSVIADFTSAPAVTVSGGAGSSAAATVILCCCLKSFTISGAGSGLGATGSVEVTALGSGFPSTAPTYANTSYQQRLVKTRRASILPTSAGTITAVGTVDDGGIYCGVNTVPILATTASLTTYPTLSAPVFGGLNDTFTILPA